MKCIKPVLAAIAMLLGAASFQACADTVQPVDTHPGHGGYSISIDTSVQAHVSPLTGTDSNGVDTAPGH